MTQKDLISEHLPMLYRLAWTLTGNEADAEDLAHDALVSALDSLGHFRSDAKLSTWLTSILINRHRTWRKSRMNRARLDRLLPTPDSDEAADVSLERSDLHAATRAAIQQLPEEERLVVVLSAYQGLDSGTIGEILGQPPGTVRSRLHEAREKLRTLLEEKLRHDE